jgi:hypothetical protein
MLKIMSAAQLAAKLEELSRESRWIVDGVDLPKC